jgi:hypothetical protein
MFFQEVTPDTSGYMIAGYVISFVVMGLYVASMYVRSRNLKQDMTTLEELDTPVSSTPAEKRKTTKPAAASAKPVTKRKALK